MWREGGDAYAYTIAGVAYDEATGAVRYLVLDPHYSGASDLRSILKKVRRLCYFHHILILLCLFFGVGGGCGFLELSLNFTPKTQILGILKSEFSLSLNIGKSKVLILRTDTLKQFKKKILDGFENCICRSSKYFPFNFCWLLSFYVTLLSCKNPLTILALGFGVWVCFNRINFGNFWTKSHRPRSMYFHGMYLVLLIWLKESSQFVISWSVQQGCVGWKAPEFWQQATGLFYNLCLPLLPPQFI